MGDEIKEWFGFTSSAPGKKRRLILWKELLRRTCGNGVSPTGWIEKGVTLGDGDRHIRSWKYEDFRGWAPGNGGDNGDLRQG